jgi:hypothetical protein
MTSPTGSPLIFEAGRAANAAYRGRDRPRYFAALLAAFISREMWRAALFR